jgi:hypothetical protein
VAVAGLLLLPGTASAKGPVVTIKPESGGPGTPITLTGTGFCGRAACGAVRITISGRQFAVSHPDGGGTFKATAQAPGGLTPGEHEVVATQVLDDGNEISAGAPFVYSPSRGEEAEREAESRDAVTNLVNSSAPTPSPRGVSLESAAAALESAAAASASASAAGASVSASAGSEQSGGGVPVALVLSIAAGTAALGAVALWWRRRSLRGAS